MDFYTRLNKYYMSVASVLRGESDAAAVFGNKSDIGETREKAYAEFLRRHAPSKCVVSLGGFLFHLNGSESKQLDVIVTTDTTPRFKLSTDDEHGKTFSPVEGALGVASIKSRLDAAELANALIGIASIPPTEPLEKVLDEGRRIHRRIPITMNIERYDDWPYKIVYASNGLESSSLSLKVEEFYQNHPEIPFCRRPNIIHIAGKALLVRGDGRLKGPIKGGGETTLEMGTLYPVEIEDLDVQALVLVLDDLQRRAWESSHILYQYGEMMARVVRGKERHPFTPTTGGGSPASTP